MTVEIAYKDMVMTNTYEMYSMSSPKLSPRMGLTRVSITAYAKLITKNEITKNTIDWKTS